MPTTTTTTTTAPTFADAAAKSAQRDNRPPSPDHGMERRAEWYAANRYSISADELAQRCADAVAYALPRLSADEQDALAQEVAIVTARREGTWTPASYRASRAVLATRATSAHRDLAKHWRDVESTASESLDAEQDHQERDHDDDADHDPATRTDALKCWLGDSLPADDANWEAVAAALDCPPDSPEADAVYAALAGYGDGVSLAAARGYSPGYARVRLSRGRAGIRKRMDADTLAALLLNADADPDAAALRTVPNPERVRLDALRTVLRRVLDGMGLTTATLPLPSPVHPDLASANAAHGDWRMDTAAMPRPPMPTDWRTRRAASGDNTRSG